MIGVRNLMASLLKIPLSITKQSHAFLKDFRANVSLRRQLYEIKRKETQAPSTNNNIKMKAFKLNQNSNKPRAALRTRNNLSWSILKLALSFGAFYTTCNFNVWGSPTDSQQLVKSVKDLLHIPESNSSFGVGVCRKYNNLVRNLNEKYKSTTERISEPFISAYNSTALLLRKNFIKKRDE